MKNSKELQIIAIINSTETAKLFKNKVIDNQNEHFEGKRQMSSTVLPSFLTILISF